MDQDMILTLLSTLYLLGDVGFTMVQAFLHLYILCQHINFYLLTDYLLVRVEMVPVWLAVL